MAEKFANIRCHTIFTPHLGPRSVILDVGANRGAFAREMSERYGGRYYLVEANPALARELRAEGRFPLWHCAVAAEEGPIRFHIARNDEGSSLLSLPQESIYNCVLRDTVEVPARRLESILAEIPAPRIDLLKMDIEGAEVQVLGSLPRAVLRTIGQITVEFHSDRLFGFDLQRGVEKVIRRLRRLGFLCLDFSYRPRRDVLFINRALHGISGLRGAGWEFRQNPPPWLLRTWTGLPPWLRNRVRRLLDRGMGTAARAASE